MHWTYDTWMLANGTGKAIVKNGGDTWFFLTSDYAFGHALSATPRRWSPAKGGKVVGVVRLPIGTTDFSSYLIQAQSSGAKVLGMANAGGDTINTIKQGAEFGIASNAGRNSPACSLFADRHQLTGPGHRPRVTLRTPSTGT